jgi:FkbM family methyltransferase
MLPTPKQLVRSLLERMGYEIRRKMSGFHADPYADQQLLMKGRDVDIILDVGANVGWTALDYAGRFPRATIHAFEPFEGSYRSLVERCRPCNRIHPHQLAIADAVSRRRLDANKDPVTNSLLPAAVGSGDYVDARRTQAEAAIDVPTTTLEAFCDDHKIAHVAILKMDIQGGEMTALRASQGLLGSRAIDLVYSEVCFAELYEG